MGLYNFLFGPPKKVPKAYFQMDDGCWISWKEMFSGADRRYLEGAEPPRNPNVIHRAGSGHIPGPRPPGAGPRYTRMGARGNANAGQFGGMSQGGFGGPQGGFGGFGGGNQAGFGPAQGGFGGGFGAQDEDFSDDEADGFGGQPGGFGNQAGGFGGQPGGFGGSHHQSQQGFAGGGFGGSHHPSRQGFPGGGGGGFGQNPLNQPMAQGSGFAQQSMNNMPNPMLNANSNRASQAFASPSMNIPNPMANTPNRGSQAFNSPSINMPNPVANRSSNRSSQAFVSPSMNVARPPRSSRPRHFDITAEEEAGIDEVRAAAWAIKHDANADAGETPTMRVAREGRDAARGGASGGGRGGAPVTRVVNPQGQQRRVDPQELGHVNQPGGQTVRGERPRGEAGPTQNVGSQNRGSRRSQQRSSRRSQFGV